MGFIDRESGDAGKEVCFRWWIRGMNNVAVNAGARQRVVVPVLDPNYENTLSVDGLFGRLQTVVANTRKTHPELTAYHLHDVALCMEEGELRAVLDFRR